MPGWSDLISLIIRQSPLDLRSDCVCLSRAFPPSHPHPLITNLFISSSSDLFIIKLNNSVTPEERITYPPTYLNQKTMSSFNDNEKIVMLTPTFSQTAQMKRDSNRFRRLLISNLVNLTVLVISIILLKSWTPVAASSLWPSDALLHPRGCPDSYKKFEIMSGYAFNSPSDAFFSIPVSVTVWIAINLHLDRWQTLEIIASPFPFLHNFSIILSLSHSYRWCISDKHLLSIFLIFLFRHLVFFHLIHVSHW